jgi:hypothetical protein
METVSWGIRWIPCAWELDAVVVVAHVTDSTNRSKPRRDSVTLQDDLQKFRKLTRRDFNDLARKHVGNGNPWDEPGKSIADLGVLPISTARDIPI